jgi:hypothetical protein
MSAELNAKSLETQIIKQKYEQKIDKDSFSSNFFFQVIFFLFETGFGSIVMVYLQTYKLCILTFTF